MRISQEYPVNINSMPQRADVVVLDGEAKPLLLAECKSADVDLGSKSICDEVFRQATRYNAVLGARYVVLTNGIRHLCFEYSSSGYIPMGSFPQLG